MHDRLTPLLDRSVHQPPQEETVRAHTLPDLQRLASDVLVVAQRLVRGSDVLDVTDVGADKPNESTTYRLKAVGDALIIQRKSKAESSPFCGLLVTPSSSGHAPRLLYDMGCLAEGSPQMVEAARMLQVVLRRASIS